MSLKFAALGSLTVSRPSRTGATTRPQHLRPVGLHEPILITFGRRSSKAEPKKPEPRAQTPSPKE